MMLSETELLYTLALQKVPNLGDVSAKKLLHHLGSAQGIFKEKESALLKIDGIGAFKLKALKNKTILDQAEEELKFIATKKLTVRYFKDTLYPERLKHCLDGPILFFETGTVDVKNKKIISIVGTRKVTRYGAHFCEHLIEELAPLDPVIVSGFAYGVDITAHKAAVKNGLQTVACLAHGMNQIYPKIHKKYISEVEKNGGFITEFWSHDSFDRSNFLKRNRIIAGISEATIVIESAQKGGSLVTAAIANSYNREVFAVPGRATDSQSMGCNTLIKSNQARLCTSAADIVYMLGWDINQSKKQPVQASLFVDLEPAEQEVYDYLSTKDKALLDVIAIDCGIPTYQLATLLLNMELKGVIRPLPGKLFQAI